MEAATAPPEVEEQGQEEKPRERPVAAAERNTAKLFQWSQWLHVGEGAEECDERYTGRCQNEDHFHAWCRLPNALQNKDITEKALAAKARRLRALKDPESDAYAIFETDLDELRESDDRDQAVREAAGDDPFDALTANADVLERPEFEHQEQDREEWLRLLTVPVEDRDEEEFERLSKQMDAFNEAANARLREIREPKRRMLTDLPWDELIERVRKVRLENWTQLTYQEVYNYWTWYIGTLRPAGVKPDGNPKRPTDRYFTSIEQLKSSPGEVVAALGQVYMNLRERMNKGTISGNS